MAFFVLHIHKQQATEAEEQIGQCDDDHRRHIQVLRLRVGVGSASQLGMRSHMLVDASRAC